jgi:hypothetical protein
MNLPLTIALFLSILVIIVLVNRIFINKHAEEKAIEKAKEILASAKLEADKVMSEAYQKSKSLNFEATNILASAKANAEKQAKEALASANSEAAIILSEARIRSKNLKEAAEKALDSATIQAGQIMDTANKKAEEIAGSAYQALKNADQLEKTAKAMKNIIEGYGDEYLVPGHSLLDDLAEEFGFTEAGTELKKARERSKLMVKNGTAANCEYVEAKRKDTAIGFVIDAFNGKVDSILSRVKNDNAGSLEQEIRDAFTLVNYNGKAFREAQIAPAYLDSRLSELKWAAVAQQIKLEEREEQRRIKEQIREEEKARRDYERAIREAAKEEDLLRKAMEKAQEQIAQASEEQKAKYETQLLDLRERLKAAEEKNQRALSMAQQTKRGNVYIISNIGSFGENVYKIGLTRRLEPMDRIRELGDSSVPFDFDVHAMIFSEDAPALETQLHKHFLLLQVNKVDYRKEFFKVDINHIKQEVEAFGLTAKWTLAAQAREYHESLAIDVAIKEDPIKREAWIKRQLQLDPVSAISDEEVIESVAQPKNNPV